MYWMKNGLGLKWLGGYEFVKEKGQWVRKFTLERVPVKGSVKKKTLYFSSWQEAKKKKWKPIKHC